MDDPRLDIYAIHGLTGNNSYSKQKEHQDSDAFRAEGI